MIILRSGVSKKKQCAESGHNADQCQSKRFTCYHCQGGHAAGNRECPKHQQEEEFTERVTRQFSTHFDLEMNEQNKQKFTPILLEKYCSEGKQTKG